MASIWQNLIEKLNSTVKLNQSLQEGIWLNIIKKGCIAHLCLNHGCPSCPQVSNKVKNIDGTFRFYPVERAIDNNESTCPANSSTWKENEIVQDVSNGKRKKNRKRKKDLRSYCSNNLISIAMDVLKNQFKQYKKLWQRHRRNLRDKN